MYKTVILLLIMPVSLLSFAQVQDPVKWSFTSKKISDKTYELHLTATIGKGWHIYSQSTPEGGPVPTAVKFSKNPLYSFIEQVKELGKLERHQEPLFGVEVKQYSNKVDFIQEVKLKNNVKTSANGSIEFMACDDKQCLPPKAVKFSISLN